MSRRAALIALALGLAACEELPTGPAAVPAAPSEPVWRLYDLDLKPFPARATLRLLPDGRAEGEGPCNRYAATWRSGPDGFRFGPVGGTERACPDLEAEMAFFAAFARVRSQAPGIETVSLSFYDESGRPVMRFVPDTGQR